MRRASLLLVFGSAALVLLAACATGGHSGTATTATTVAGTTATTQSTASTSELPMGDGKVSTTSRAGYVMRCGQGTDPNGGGAFRDGPWIHGTTWDPSAKLAVQGSVAWPQAAYSVQVSGS
jgi:hypothetical protein